MLLMQDTTSHDDALWYQRANKRDQTQREIAGCQRPGRMVGGQLVRWRVPAGCQGRTGGESFQTIAMVGTETREWIHLPVVGNADVPHLRVQEAVEHAPVDHGTTPDTSAYSDVEKGLKALGCSPALFSECRRVHIGVESYWKTQSPAERP